MKRFACVILTLLLILASMAYAQEEISSVKLNSLLVDNTMDSNHLRLLIQAKKAGNFEPIIDIKEATQKSLEYFFIGLTMPEEKFWVNLNPDEPFRVIDSALSNTDLGRIMLKADLNLKEDTCELTNPQDSQIGKEFWNRLYKKAEELGVTDNIPVITRLWIVPDEVVVFETQNQLSLIKARLKVCLESAYLSQDIKIKDKRQKELQDYASRLMEELVLPFLNKRVNEDFSYVDLREVYQALILAQWYKQNFGYQDKSLLHTVNLNVLKDTEIALFYSPDEIYRDYLKSLKEGTYSFTETDTKVNSFYTTISTRHYFSGGVDFRNMRITKVNDSAQLQAQEDASYFTCDLYLPQGIDRPLQYAKNNLELTEGGILFNNEQPIALAKNLPAITPMKFAQQRIQNLDSVGRMDRLVLSKL